MKLKDIKEDIYYINIENNKVMAHTKSGVVRLKEKFDNLLDNLSDEYKLAHVNCVVNIKYVKCYDYVEGCFILKNNERVNMLLKKYNLPF